MTRETARDAFAFVALFSLWDGDGIRDLLSWWGFSALSLLLLAGGIVILVRARTRVRALLGRSSSLPLLVFVGLCLASAIWSNYPVATLLCSFIQLATATVGIAVALLRSPVRLAQVFFAVLHVHLALALLFEIAVAVLPIHPLMPFFTEYGANAPGAYAWSQGLLFTGQRIQGIVGNANLTCFIALLALIMLVGLIAAKRLRFTVAGPAAVLDIGMFALTRSGTVIIAGGTVAAVALLLIGYRRARGAGRALLVVAALAVIGLVTLGSSRVSTPVLAVLGKGDDYTGRLEIWTIVGRLVLQRPLLGWGWVGYWPPWVEPYDRLIVRGGVQYLQAHNAYLDVALQLGAVGLLSFALLIGTVVVRALHLATTRLPLATLPLLLVTALLGQGLAESRLLIEGNWAMLAALAVVLPWGRRGAPPRSVAHAADPAPEEGRPTTPMSATA